MSRIDRTRADRHCAAGAAGLPARHPGLSVAADHHRRAARRRHRHGHHRAPLRRAIVAAAWQAGDRREQAGRGFLVATQSVLAAPADGHTLLVAAPSNLAYNQTLYKQLPYDPEKDLVPISHYLTSPFILVVNPALPVHTVPEFIKYAKAQADAAELQHAGRHRRAGLRGRGDGAAVRAEVQPRAVPQQPAVDPGRFDRRDQLCLRRGRRLARR